MGLTEPSVPFGKDLVDEDDDEDDDEADSDATLAKVFMEVVRKMQLSEGEAAALRLSIARDDVDVRAALEVFKIERDEADFQDTLRRVSGLAVLLRSFLVCVLLCECVLG